MHRRPNAVVITRRTTKREQEECKATEPWSSLTTAFLVLLEQLAPTERAVLVLREVFELDFDGIARSVGKSEANTRQILTRARGRLRASRPRFTVFTRPSIRSH
jgi:DNA-directed RNA polymerase specialized sigma24 family protein